MVEKANRIWENGPGSSPSQPDKYLIRQWGTRVEGWIDALSTNSSIIKASKALLDADLAHSLDTLAWVIEDSTPANNGIYRKVGALGSGSWTRVADLPYSVLYAQNAGSGTANAVVATSSVPVSTAAYAQLISVPFTAANTGAVTLAINGETPRPVVTNTGAAIEAGYVQAGMSALIQIDSDGNYRLFSYGDASAIQAAVEALLVSATAEADRAESAAGSVASAPQWAFADKAATEAFTPAASPDFISLLGRAAAGDLGAFNDRAVPFFKEASEPSHAFKIQIASSGVPWFGFRGKDVVPELLGPPTDAAGPVQDCIDYLADNASLAAANGGKVRFGEAEYDIGTTTIKLKSQIHLVGLGRGSNADGYLSRIKYTGTGNALAPDDATKQLNQVKISELLILAPNCLTSIVNAKSIQWLDFEGNWLFGSPTNNPVGLFLPPYTEAATITGITKANPGVVTAATHGRANGDQVYVAGVVGMTQVNGRWFTVANATTDTFALSGVDTSAYGTYTSGGTATKLVTDPTYARVRDNYVGGVGTAFDLRDANAAIITGNRAQPNASGKGFYLGSLGPYLGSPNQTTLIGNSVETDVSGVIAYQFGPTALDFVALGNRVELPGASTFGFYAEAGARNIVLSGGNDVTAATPVLDAGYAFSGSDPIIGGVEARITGSTGALIFGKNVSATGIRTSTGTYDFVFPTALLDVNRYAVEAQAFGGFYSTSVSLFTTTGIRVQVASANFAVGSFDLADPTSLFLSIRSR